jgi:hypothetical protein
MTGALVARWGGNVPGREAKGLEVFGKAVERFEQLQKQGRIHAHHAYLAGTGEVGGFMIVEGELEELQKILVETETLSLNAQAAAICQNFSMQLYIGGSDQTVQQTIGTYVEALGAIGYM